MAGTRQTIEELNLAQPASTQELKQALQAINVKIAELKTISLPVQEAQAGSHKYMAEIVDAIQEKISEDGKFLDEFLKLNPRANFSNSEINGISITIKDLMQRLNLVVREAKQEIRVAEINRLRGEQVPMGQPGAFLLNASNPANAPAQQPAGQNPFPDPKAAAEPAQHFQPIPVNPVVNPAQPQGQPPVAPPPESLPPAPIFPRAPRAAPPAAAAAAAPVAQPAQGIPPGAAVPVPPQVAQAQEAPVQQPPEIAALRQAAQQILAQLNTPVANAPAWYERVRRDLREAAGKVNNANGQNEAQIKSDHQTMLELQNELAEFDRVNNDPNNNPNNLSNMALRRGRDIAFIQNLLDTNDIQKIERNLELIADKIAMDKEIADLSQLTDWANKCNQIRERLESFLAVNRDNQILEGLRVRAENLMRQVKPLLERQADQLFIHYFSHSAELIQDNDQTNLDYKIEQKVKEFLQPQDSRMRLVRQGRLENINATTARVNRIESRDPDTLLDAPRNNQNRGATVKTFNSCSVDKISNGRIVSEIFLDHAKIKKLDKKANENKLDWKGRPLPADEQLEKKAAQREMLKIAIRLIENIRAVNPDLKTAIRMEGDFPRGLVNAMIYYCDIQQQKDEKGYAYLNLTKHTFDKQPGTYLNAEDELMAIQREVFREQAGKPELKRVAETNAMKQGMDYEDHSNKRPRF